MADLVASQTIVDGPRNAVIKLTCISDGTGETGVTKVNMANLSAMGPARNLPTSVSIKKITYDIQSMAVRLLWDATTPLLIIELGNAGNSPQDYTKNGMLQNNAGVGKNGNILLTSTAVGATTAPPTGSSYTITLELVKKYN